MKKNLLSKKNKKSAVIVLVLIFLALVLAKAIPFWGDRLGKYFYDKVCFYKNGYQDELIVDFTFPARNWNTEHYSSQAESVFAAFISEKSNDKVLLSENAEKQLPIASITKLMTALIVLEEYDLKSEIVITENAFAKDMFNPKNLRTGEQYIVSDLLFSLLLESSNTTAYALAENQKEIFGDFYSREEEISLFISKMNRQAKEIGMKETVFFNPSGLDPSGPRGINLSTGKDISKLLSFLIEKRPEIWEILSLSEYELRMSNGTFKKKISNTNELIGKVPEIMGGKTGRTSRAGECLALVTAKSDGYIITVILGSHSRFEETEKLLDWINRAYYWNI